MQLHLFDMTEKLLINQTRLEGKAMTVSATAQDGKALAEGVYLYVVTVRGAKGEVVRTRVEKLVVRR